MKIIISAITASIFLPAASYCASASPTYNLPATGDNTPYALLWLIIAIAAVIIIGVIISLRKK